MMCILNRNREQQRYHVVSTYYLLRYYFVFLEEKESHSVFSLSTKELPHVVGTKKLCWRGFENKIRMM